MCIQVGLKTIEKYVGREDLLECRSVTYGRIPVEDTLVRPLLAYIPVQNASAPAAIPMPHLLVQSQKPVHPPRVASMWGRVSLVKQCIDCSGKFLGCCCSWTSRCPSSR